LARNYENWIQGYVEYTSELEAPTSFHVWTAIGTLAGALRGKVHIDMGYFRWKPNFFIIFVAPPGVVSKSTTAGVGMGILRTIDDIQFGPDSITWQALTEAFAEAEKPVPELGTSTSSLTVVASELGTFLDPKNRELVDVLNDLWDGRSVSWKRRTKGEGTTEIKNPWLNLLGCTTPAWIQENFPQYAIGGGFTSRTVFVYGETKRKLSPYPKKAMDAEGEHYKLARAKLASDLREVAKITGEYILDDSAQKWGEAWYERHWTTESPDVDREVHGGYIARKQTHLHKTALVLASARHSERVISAENLAEADQIITALERDFRKVFASMSANKDVHAQQVVLGAIVRVKKMEKRQLYRSVMTLMSWQQFELCCEALTAADLVEQSAAGNQIILRVKERAR
jgi:hypothetical protein